MINASGDILIFKISTTLKIFISGSVRLSMWKTFYRKDSEKISLEIKKETEEKTSLQLVNIVDTKTFGKALFLDNSPQSSEIDEFIYHESLVHPALVAHADPQKILVGGGAEGCTIREVLRHNTVRKTIMIDIDEELVEFCRDNLRKWHKDSFSDSRVEVHCNDVRKFLENSHENYDCILLDVTAPIQKGLSQLLFTQKFYKIVKKHLEDDGIFITQSQSASINNLEPLLSIIKTLKTIFPIVTPIVFYDPLCSDLWSAVIASRKYDPRSFSREQVDQILAQRKVRGLRFYDGITHLGIISTPKYLREMMEKKGRILTDTKPFSWK
jgi:spermidine synthase